MTALAPNQQQSTQISVGTTAVQLPAVPGGITIINLTGNPVDISDVPTSDLGHLNPSAQTVLPGNGQLVWNSSTGWAICPTGNGLISVIAGSHSYFNPNPTLAAPQLDNSDVLLESANFGSLATSPVGASVGFSVGNANYEAIAVAVTTLNGLPVTYPIPLWTISLEVMNPQGGPFMNQNYVLNPYGITETSLFKIPYLNSNSVISITVAWTGTVSPNSILVYGCRGIPEGIRSDCRMRPTGQFHANASATNATLIAAPTGLKRIMIRSSWLSWNGASGGNTEGQITGSLNGVGYRLLDAFIPTANAVDSVTMTRVDPEGVLLDPNQGLSCTFTNGSGRCGVDYDLVY